MNVGELTLWNFLHSRVQFDTTHLKFLRSVENVSSFEGICKCLPVRIVLRVILFCVSWYSLVMVLNLAKSISQSMTVCVTSEDSVPDMQVMAAHHTISLLKL